MTKEKKAPSLESIKEEDKWKIESDARTIKDFFEIKQDKDRFEKAIKLLEEENSTVSQSLKEVTAYKESIGFKKK